MSATIVTITNKKKNELEFEIEVEGLTVEPSDIRFVIETSEMDYAFKCSKKKGNTCTVSIPALSQLEKTMYPFRIEVVIDGYHFTPMKGQVNVVGSFDVYATEPKNKTVAPPKKKEEKKTVESAGPIAKIAKKADEKKKPVSEDINPTEKSVLDLSLVDADKLVKDAITNLKGAKISHAPIEKTPTKPFFKKVTEDDKKVTGTVEPVEKSVPDKPEPSQKDKAVHAILEKKEEKPAAPAIVLKKGKRVKS